MIRQSRGEIGSFLRSRREKLDPETFCLHSGRKRRTPGLRREEVAELAGIGVDWYIRLEQGRAVTPSIATINALAQALRLNAIEHAHLRALAQNRNRPAFSRESVPDAIHRLIQDLKHPAYVTGRRWDVLAWNAAAADVFTDFGRVAEDDRNILLFMFADPSARRLFGEAWADEAKRMLAQFRPAYDLWAGDPAFVDLTDRLRQLAPEFTRWWQDHTIRGGAAGHKQLHHPEKGLLRFDYASFQSNDDPSLKLVIYTSVAVS